MVTIGSSTLGALLLVLAVSGCGGDVRITDGDDAEGGNAQDGGASQGPGSAQGGSNAQGTSNAQGGSSAQGGSGTGGATPTVWSGQTYSTMNCNEVVQLYVEIWPDNATSEACLPAASIDPAQVLVIEINDWDRDPGTFPLDVGTAHGVASAGLAGAEGANGSITVEPYGDVPGVISWDLDVGKGSTDLSLCFQPPEEACPDPL